MYMRYFHLPADRDWRGRAEEPHCTPQATSREPRAIQVTQGRASRAQCQPPHPISDGDGDEHTSDGKARGKAAVIDHNH